MKTILITGATRGLGLEIAKSCVQQGYKVLGLGRKESEGFKTLQSESLYSSGALIFCPFDLSATTGYQDFSRDILKTHGPIYGLINNAAIGLDGVLATMHENEIMNMLQVNVAAPILMTKYISRSMLVQREGRIINISSIIANTGFNGLSVYAATKAALIGFTKSLAREVGRVNITVNAICPGYMETDMTNTLRETDVAKIIRRSPLNRLTNVEDVVGMILHLLGAQAGSTTGATFTIDSGSSA